MGKWMSGYVPYRASHLGVATLKDILTRKWSVPNIQPDSVLRVETNGAAVAAVAADADNDDGGGNDDVDD